MKRFHLLFLLLWAPALLQAENPVYDAAAISKNLLPYASAVVRSLDFTTEVRDENNTIFHIRKVVTILNRNGDDNAELVVWHNKFNQIRYIKGTLYDEFGKPVRKFSESDFDDFSAGGSSLFEDSRVKHFKPAATAYPYTLEYEYEIRSRQSLNFEDWKPMNDYGTALESSTCTFICKPGFNVRYKEFNYPGKVVTATNKDGMATYTWRINNLKAIKSEPYSPDNENYLTVVKFAPKTFSYDGHSGSFSNWKELGQWMYSDLLSSRSQLSPETVTQMQELVKGITDDRLKAKKIYEYMQQKTRYISVQTGIGGYQPFPASEVDQLSYGDCKALVNYTQALLKAVNISSWYCIVQAGDRKESLIPDFASMNQANHVILCLPFKNDTTWLECTSKEIPFGYLGTFTDDRNVLACTPQGGLILHTPKYTAANNSQVCHADFRLSDDGQLEGKVETAFEGAAYEDQEYLTGKDQADQVKALKKYYGIDNLDVVKLDYRQEKKQLPVTRQNLQLKAPSFAANTDGKLYFFANATNRRKSVPREVRNRTTEVYINRGYTDTDEITYTLPEGYRLDNTPLELNLSKPFGNYTSSLTQQGNRLIYKRRMVLKDGTYSKDTYQDLVDFYQAVVEADNQSVVLTKK